MKRWLCLASVVLLTGCSTLAPLKAPSNPVTVGQVPVRQHLNNLGGNVDTTLVLATDATGHAFMQVNDGPLAVSLDFADGERQQLEGVLAKALEWAAISKREGLEAQKEVGTVQGKSASPLLRALVQDAKDIGWNYNSVKATFRAEAGQVCLVDLFITDAAIVQSANGRGMSTVTLTEASVQRLLELLQAVPGHTEKAAVMAQKKDLLLR